MSIIILLLLGEFLSIVFRLASEPPHADLR